VDDGCIDRDDAGALGIVAKGRKSAVEGIIYAGAYGSCCWCFLDGLLGDERRKAAVADCRLQGDCAQSAQRFYRYNLDGSLPPIASLHPEQR
jgi:hypothetical protein